MKDPDLEIIKSFETPGDDQGSKWTDGGYIVADSVLYRYSPDGEEYHNSPTAANSGVERTLQRIVRKYYFVGIRQY